MRVPYSWLKEYVELTETAEEAAELLQSVGVPVENIEYEGAEVTGVVSCLVKSIAQHPDAERLRVCQVDIGSAQLQIVTAATNVREGMVTAVACHGSLLAGGTKIKKGKLRGVMSEGMFCSYPEIGLDPEDYPEELREGILDLPADSPLGKPIQELMPVSEAVFIVESFANRADQLSILGVARELAAKLNRPLLIPPTANDYSGATFNDDSDSLVKIDDLTACPRFAARAVENITIAPSPKWMVRRLELAGMRSINNVVDITNYVMLETGQPLHAYDRKAIEGGIVVRRAAAEESLVTLDGEEHKLPQNTIVIADHKKIIGAAGVMGGLNSEIAPDTKELLLESACFDNGDVRRASLRMGLRTEASKRFEKGMDVERVAFGLQRAAYLFGELVGTLNSKITVKGAEAPQPVKVTLRTARLQKVLGISVPVSRVSTILTALGFSIAADGDGENLEVTVPSHRIDVVEEVDLIEEVARHYGYDNLPLTIPASAQQAIASGDDEDEEYFRDLAIRLGLSEILTPSLCSLEMYRRYRQDDEPLQVMNPLSEDQRVLRSHIFPFMCETIQRNLRVRNNDLRFFEISRVYKKSGDNVQEPKHLSLGLSYEGVDFFAIKGLVERFAELLGVKLSFAAANLPWGHPGRSAEITLDGKKVGWLGEIHPSLAHELELTAPLMLAELDIAALYTQKAPVAYKTISRFPSVERDLAFLLAADMPVGKVSDRFAQVGGDLVADVRCFDVYTGEQVPAGFKSVAFRFVLRSFERTLTDEDISKAMRKMQKIAEREFSAKLRD